MTATQNDRYAQRALRLKSVPCHGVAEGEDGSLLTRNRQAVILMNKKENRYESENT